MKTKILLFCCLFALGLGCGAGYRYLTDNKTVAIRVGQPQRLVDYDLMCSINFISYQLEKKGYNVLGVSYAGDLYPSSLNRAKNNIFIRAFEPFFDVRFQKDKKNTFYVERFVRQYVEEFVGYDSYITSQRSIQQEMAHIVKMQYLPSGAVPHPLLEPNYRYDVLYIYETPFMEYVDFLKQYIKNAKIYGGATFANLTENERQAELSKAKLVVYIVDMGVRDDLDFVPFAVYDIISYGRPLLTNYTSSLARDFSNNVFLFDSINNVANNTLKVLQMPNRIREDRAKAARDILNTKVQDTPQIFN